MFGEIVTRFRLNSFVFLTLLLATVGDRQSLYSESDRLVTLNATSFETALVGADNAWAVEFYNVYCGHCRHFAPVWKQIGKEVADWYPVLRLGVVACSDDINTPVCRHYDIKAYPTIKLLPARCRKDYIGEDYEGSMELTELKQSLIDYVESYPVNQRAKACPNLDPLRSLDDIWNDVTADTRHTVLVFEDDDSYLGRQLQLDMVLHKQLVIRRMLKQDVAKFGVTKVPAMYLIDREGTFRKLVESTDDGDYKQELHALLGLTYTPIELEPELKPDNERIKDAAAQDKVDYKAAMTVHQQDLQSALQYSLRHEVAIHKHIDGDTLTALKNYVAVLGEYFPGPDHICQFLKQLNKWLKGLDTLTGFQWLQHIDEIQTKTAHLPSSTIWTGCQGSSPRYRGYPCSLWTLFHTLSVNYVLQQPKEMSSEPHKILRAMRGYIKTFFGCHECIQNFMKSAAYIETRVHSPDESILFLWRSHNRANGFLKDDITEDPQHPKLQFPSSQMCPNCHVTAPDGTEGWDEKEVLQFLKVMYAKENIIQDVKYGPYQGEPVAKDVDDGWAKFKRDDARKNDLSKLSDLKSQKKANQQNRIDSVFGKNDLDLDVKPADNVVKWQQVEVQTRYSMMPAVASWGFNSIDISMCVLFYLLCTGIIVLVYYHFMRGRRKFTRSFLPL